jgi:hypothetical protein
MPTITKRKDKRQKDAAEVKAAFEKVWGSYGSSCTVKP